MSEPLPSPSGRGSGDGETGVSTRYDSPSSVLFLGEGAKGASLAVPTLMAPMLPVGEGA